MKLRPFIAYIQYKFSFNCYRANYLWLIFVYMVYMPLSAALFMLPPDPKDTVVCSDPIIKHFNAFSSYYSDINVLIMRLLQEKCHLKSHYEIVNSAARMCLYKAYSCCQCFIAFNLQY